MNLCASSAKPTEYAHYMEINYAKQLMAKFMVQTQ